MSKAEELILEMLLLRQRYSRHDFDAARRAFEREGTDPFLQDIARLLSRGLPHKTTRRVTQNILPRERLDSFIQELKTTKSRKRIDSVSKRLGIDASRDKDYFDQIRARLTAMPDDELQEFLRPYKLSGGTDQGYLGLASYLIHNE